MQLAAGTSDQGLELVDDRDRVCARDDDEELVATPASDNRPGWEGLEEPCHARERLIAGLPVLVIESVELAQIVDVDEDHDPRTHQSREDVVEPATVAKAGQIVIQPERGALLSRRESVAKICGLPGKLTVAPLECLQSLMELAGRLDAVCPLDLPQEITCDRLRLGPRLNVVRSRSRILVSAMRSG